MPPRGLALPLPLLPPLGLAEPPEEPALPKPLGPTEPLAEPPDELDPADLSLPEPKRPRLKAWPPPRSTGSGLGRMRV